MTSQLEVIPVLFSPNGTKICRLLFSNKNFLKQKNKYITGTKVGKVNADDLAKIKIPVPPKENKT